MLQWFKNFVEHPSTTIQGVVGGGAVLAVAEYMATEMHCDWTLFSWTGLAMFLIPIIIGGGSGGMFQKPASSVTPPVA